MIKTLLNFILPVPILFTLIFSLPAYSQTFNLVADINPAGDSQLDHLTVFNSKLYFWADNGTNGSELWAYDGISSFNMVTNINPNPNGHSYPSDLTVFNAKLYFAADNGTNGRELWVYKPFSWPKFLPAVINNNKP